MKIKGKHLGYVVSFVLGTFFGGRVYAAIRKAL